MNWLGSNFAKLDRKSQSFTMEDSGGEPEEYAFILASVGDLAVKSIVHNINLYSDRNNENITYAFHEGYFECLGMCEPIRLDVTEEQAKIILELLFE